MSESIHTPFRAIRRRAPALADLIVECNQIAVAGAGDTNRIASLYRA
jgi:hypothetical protein